MNHDTRKLNWDGVYRENSPEEMGWYYPPLDPDLENALEKMDIRSGTFLDLGTGPGTQAYELSNRGFGVTGTDISDYAIEKARKRFDKVSFMQDDILHTHLRGPFDFILDRGCFHTFNEDERSGYVKAVRPLLRPGGMLFLKCFSNREPDGWGPYRLSEGMIEESFAGLFEIVSMRHTMYQGTRRPLPKALFVVMKTK